MSTTLDKLMPATEPARRWTAVGLTVVVSGLLTLWGIYGIGQYGLALFVCTPLLIGAGSTLLYGYGRRISRADAAGVGFLALAVFTGLLLLCAIEGFICIAMAAPFGILLTWVGTLLGHTICQHTPGQAPATLLVLVGFVPLTAVIEQEAPPTLSSVVSSIDIGARPEQVWQQVIQFPRLAEPTEFLFKAGIAYPIDAQIKGTGVGAVRHCNFNTGSFVEPITVWDEPRLLRFDVVEQPAPLNELSFWSVDAPHLHDYFVSRQGQFKLTALPNGHTRLEGTTWYYHNIKPAAYWHLWSDYIVHAIHERVLTHIKARAEGRR